MPAQASAHFTIEPLDKKKHNRAAFSCEHEALNVYLKERASQDVQKRVAAVYVLTPDGKTIAYHEQLTAGYEADGWRGMLYDRQSGTIENLSDQGSVVENANPSRCSSSGTVAPNVSRMAMPSGLMSNTAKSV